MRLGATVLAGLSLTLGLAGCAPEPADGPQPEPTSTSPSTPTPTEQQWQRFTDARVPQSFELPANWSVRVEYEEPANEIFGFGIFDAADAKQLELRWRVMGLGGGCGDEDPTTFPEFVVLDRADLALSGYAAPTDDAAPERFVQPHVAFTAFQNGDRVETSLAVVNTEPGGSCRYYSLLHTSQGYLHLGDGYQIPRDAETDDFTSKHFFATMAEAKAYVDTDEYKTLKRILASLRFGA